MSPRWEITVEADEELPGWSAIGFMVDDDGESGDAVLFGAGPYPQDALEDLADNHGDRMLCHPDNPWCDYDEEAITERHAEWGPYRVVCREHPGLRAEREEIR